MSTVTEKEPRRLTGRSVLFMLIGFFAVVGAVNVYFVFMALDTWPGLVSQQYYKDGLAYNHVLDDAAKQDKLGWHTALKLAPGAIGESRELAIVYQKNDGSPVTGLDVKVTMQRPIGVKDTTKLPLREVAPGRYVTQFTPILAGRWKADFEAYTADKTHFRIIHELMIKP